MLRQDRPLDFELPFSPKSRERVEVVRVFRERCASGDERACRIAAQVSESSTMYEVVAQNCVNGDHASCLTLPPDTRTRRFPSVPGAMSRSMACQLRDDAACNVTMLRTECLARFPAACDELANKAVPATDADWARLGREYGRASCASDVVRDCQNVDDFDQGAERMLANATRTCELVDDCSKLGTIYRESSEPLKARDAFERQCEYSSDFMVCVRLGEMYVLGELPEPVPGRGQALLKWGCPQSVVEKSRFVKMFPACSAY